ncbi:3-phosphoshikimate 1-carboxyvinyltransferase [Micromonospora andamanensis]|uniref:3-phosphoshikimate 1-carboxyvinyltransferase n=1 Tax=Micromonospora andamanensis TaxID=1287068 RepID=A0ABQ4HVR5_9ACTN|nr:3-phosphoshikimate 1-carboxyvinyltransferase [Micromonospora andamanensis]GIJ09769.1 3-phosphoshikimate 1-carboxyvinyltransferase [Micromonospora andamanensis]
MSAVWARVPGSKSLTNRALAIAAMADGVTELDEPLVSDDTTAFANALVALGVPVERQARRWIVTGMGGAPRLRSGGVWCEDAGTAARFLPPVAAAGGGAFDFDGTDQLRARPLRPLIDALRALGATVEPAGDGGGLPFRLVSDGLKGGELTLTSRTSSQYLSGLLMAGPLMANPLTVVAPELVSRPYIDMTIALMARFGVRVTESGPDRFTVHPGRYVGTRYSVEPDASTASYVFAAAAVTGSEVSVNGLGSASLQGDSQFVDVLSRAGAEVTVESDRVTVRGPRRLRGGFTVDMGPISDTFMTLAAIAPLADAPIRITGVGHARLKESDRIDAMAQNLASCGVPVRTGPDWIEISPMDPSPALIHCRRDHRIAMSFSVLGLRVHGLVLDDPACVSKTFPGCHAELARLFGGDR